MTLTSLTVGLSLSLGHQFLAEAYARWQEFAEAATSAAASGLGVHKRRVVSFDGENQAGADFQTQFSTNLGRNHDAPAFGHPKCCS